MRWLRSWIDARKDEMQRLEEERVARSASYYINWIRPRRLMASLSSDGTNSGETQATRDAFTNKQRWGGF